jgi:purine catabolism regulator
MEITVADVIALPEYKDIHFVAGEGGVGRVVRGANIIEVPTVTHWLKGGEILFSSGFAFGGDDERGCLLLEELSERNISALVLKPGDYLKTIGESMKRCANRLNVPLLAIPESRPYSHYMDPIYGLLLNQKAKTLEVASSIYGHLFNIAVDSSYKSLCSFVSESLKQPVFLLDEAGKILAGSDTIHDDVVYSAFAMLSNQEKCNVRFIHEMTYPVEGKNTRFLSISIDFPQKHCGYLVAIQTEEADYELSIAVLPFVARIIQIQEMHNFSLLQQENRIAGDLLGDIIEKRYEDLDIVIQRGKKLHIDLSEHLVVFVIHVGRKNMQKNEFSSRANVISFSMRQMIREAIISVSPRVLFLDHGDSIVALLQVRQSLKQTDLDRIVLPIFNLGIELQGFVFSVGISRIVRGVESVPKLYNQALTACKMATVKNPSSHSTLFYSELGVGRLFPELKNSQEMKLLVGEVVEPILKYDRENQTDYFRVFQVFYANNGVISKTADQLFVHKNTMIKYLKTLEQITGFDLRDYRTVTLMKMCSDFYDLMVD